jgi:hypothetical protein
MDFGYPFGILYLSFSNHRYLLRASGAGLKIMSTFIFGFGFMVFNATFNNISAILWQSVLLEKETRVPRENHRSVASN